MEIFKICLENYEISNLGNVRRLMKNGEYKYIKGSIMSKGYRYFQYKKKKGYHIKGLIIYIIS